MSRPCTRVDVEPTAGPLGRWLALPLIGAIHLYRATLSPLLGGQCRFEPTCSCYGLNALRIHGPIRGLRLTIGRVCRCHPWSAGGYDPVPLPDGEPVTDRGADRAASTMARSDVPREPE